MTAPHNLTREIFGDSFCGLGKKDYLCIDKFMIGMKVLVRIIFAVLFLATAAGAAAQTKNTRQTREEYIYRYRRIAVDHMERYGIPASITLAQGILESDCGNSRLSRSSNNHFGIKCKKDWTGNRVYHDDDEKGECFRSYETVEESYEDHARFLDNSPRYEKLFSYPTDDYRSWAHGLKAAGYATAPDYALRLIKIIEESKLYLFDRPSGIEQYDLSTRPIAAEGKNPAERVPGGTPGPGRIDPDNFMVSVSDWSGYPIYREGERYYTLPREGDTYEKIGATFRISARNLRKFNDAAAGVQPANGQKIFLGKKRGGWGKATTKAERKRMTEQLAQTTRKTAQTQQAQKSKARPAKSRTPKLHTVEQGETLYSIAGKYGLEWQRIARRNKIDPRNPVIYIGQELHLR